MAGIALVGMQWGDEGKGKATDLISSCVDYVVKYNGGNNAGHTVKVGDASYALHLLPSGVLTPGVVPVITNGVVTDLDVLRAEMDGLQNRGVDVSQLRVAAGAHIIMPYNVALDRARDSQEGALLRLGTTGRGVGPTYSDKMNRVGLRVQDIFDVDLCRDKLRALLPEKNMLLDLYGHPEPFDVEAMLHHLSTHRDWLEPHVVDGSVLLNDALERGETVLFEASQAAMLDIDHGTYPYVTSSSCTTGGACASAGISPGAIEMVVGVLKAYTTRVGEGPFPCELDADKGDWLREAGREYGVTTGRPRRCGWLDTVAARHAVRVNGVTDIVLTKIDVLSGLPYIPVCVGYDTDRRSFSDMPSPLVGLGDIRPRYEDLEGWDEDISGVRDFAKLPIAAQRYVLRIEELLGVGVSAVGTGPGREDIIVRGGKLAQVIGR